MSRLMSVSLTEDAVRARTKTVTRRVGWLMLKPGDRLTLCRKVMGRQGAPLVRIAEVEVVSAWREALSSITPTDVELEGFPTWTVDEFVGFFIASHRGTTPESEVTRIAWKYVDTRVPGYRPSNGTDGDFHRARSCNRCVKDHAWHVPPFEADESCPIIMDALSGEHSYPNPLGPPEWWRDSVTGETGCSEMEAPCPCA